MALVETMLGTKELKAKLRISQTKLTGLLRTPDFPKPFRIGAGSNRYLESEVDFWIDRQIAARP